MTDDFVFDFVHMSIDFVPGFATAFESDSDEDDSSTEELEILSESDGDSGDSVESDDDLEDECKRLCTEASGLVGPIMEDIDGASEEQIRKPLALYEKALALSPNFVPALTGAAYLAGLLGEVEGARTHLQAALGERPGDANLLEMLASLEAEEEESEAPQVSAGTLIQDGVVSTQFLELDRDGDGVLNTAELHGYHKLVNGTPAPAEVLRFLKENFQWRNGLTPEGFVNFYCSQSVEDLEETFKDLGALGYGRNLNPL